MNQPTESTLQAILAELQEVNARLSRAETAIDQARPLALGLWQKIASNSRVRKMLQ